MIIHFKACKLHRFIKSTLAQDASEDDKVKDNLALPQIHQAIVMLAFGKIITADMTNKS